MLLACSQASPNFQPLVVWKSGPLIFRSCTGRAWERGYYAARHTHTHTHVIYRHVPQDADLPAWAQASLSPPRPTSRNDVICSGAGAEYDLVCPFMEALGTVFGRPRSEVCIVELME